MNSNKLQQFDEFNLLDLFYQKMIEEGSKHNMVRLSIDNRTVEYAYEKTSCSVTVEELIKLADICLANNWLEHTSLGGKYLNLQLTTTGFGVVTSKRRQKEVDSTKGYLKRISDYIDEHKGLFIFLGFLIALISLYIKFQGIGGANG